MSRITYLEAQDDDNFVSLEFIADSYFGYASSVATNAEDNQTFTDVVENDLALMDDLAEEIEKLHSQLDYSSEKKTFEEWQDLVNSYDDQLKQISDRLKREIVDGQAVTGGRISNTNSKAYIPLSGRKEVKMEEQEELSLCALLAKQQVSVSAGGVKRNAEGETITSGSSSSSSEESSSSETEDEDMPQLERETKQEESKVMMEVDSTKPAKAKRKLKKNNKENRLFFPFNEFTKDTPIDVRDSLLLSQNSELLEPLFYYSEDEEEDQDQDQKEEKVTAVAMNEEWEQAFKPISYEILCPSNAEIKKAVAAELNSLAIKLDSQTDLVSSELDAEKLFTKRNKKKLGCLRFLLRTLPKLVQMNMELRFAAVGNSFDALIDVNTKFVGWCMNAIVTASEQNLSLLAGVEINGQKPFNNQPDVGKLQLALYMQMLESYKVWKYLILLRSEIPKLFKMSVSVLQKLVISVRSGKWPSSEKSSSSHEILDAIQIRKQYRALRLYTGRGMFIDGDGVSYEKTEEELEILQNLQDYEIVEDGALPAELIPDYKEMNKMAGEEIYSVDVSATVYDYDEVGYRIYEYWVPHQAEFMFPGILDFTENLKSVLTAEYKVSPSSEESVQPMLKEISYVFFRETVAKLNIADDLWKEIEKRSSIFLQDTEYTDLAVLYREMKMDSQRIYDIRLNGLKQGLISVDAMNDNQMVLFHGYNSDLDSLYKRFALVMLPRLLRWIDYLENHKSFNFKERLTIAYSRYGFKRGEEKTANTADMKRAWDSIISKYEDFELDEVRGMMNELFGDVMIFGLINKIREQQQLNSQVVVQFSDWLESAKLANEDVVVLDSQFREFNELMLAWQQKVDKKKQLLLGSIEDAFEVEVGTNPEQIFHWQVQMIFDFFFAVKDNTLFYEESFVGKLRELLKHKPKSGSLAQFLGPFQYRNFVQPESTNVDIQQMQRNSMLDKKIKISTEQKVLDAPKKIATRYVTEYFRLDRLFVELLPEFHYVSLDNVRARMKQQAKDSAMFKDSSEHYNEEWAKLFKSFADNLDNAAKNTKNRGIVAKLKRIYKIQAKIQEQINSSIQTFNRGQGSDWRAVFDMLGFTTVPKNRKRFEPKFVEEKKEEGDRNAKIAGDEAEEEKQDMRENAIENFNRSENEFFDEDFPPEDQPIPVPKAKAKAKPKPKEDDSKMQVDEEPKLTQLLKQKKKVPKKAVDNNNNNSVTVVRKEYTPPVDANRFVKKLKTENNNNNSNNINETKPRSQFFNPFRNNNNSNNNNSSGPTQADAFRRFEEQKLTAWQSMQKRIPDAEIKQIHPAAIPLPELNPLMDYPNRFTALYDQTKINYEKDTEMKQSPTGSFFTDSVYKSNTDGSEYFLDLVSGSLTYLYKTVTGRNLFRRIAPQLSHTVEPGFIYGGEEELEESEDAMWDPQDRQEKRLADIADGNEIVRILLAADKAEDEKQMDQVLPELEWAFDYILSEKYASVENGVHYIDYAYQENQEDRRKAFDYVEAMSEQDQKKWVNGLQEYWQQELTVRSLYAQFAPFFVYPDQVNAKKHKMSYTDWEKFKETQSTKVTKANLKLDHLYFSSIKPLVPDMI